MKKENEGGYGDHISHEFNEDLAALNADFLKMGYMVGEQLTNAVAALMDGDGFKADEVRAKDKIVDKLELEIDDEAVRIIARRQPAARDLRLVIAVIKMVADLERVGDEAKKIAKSAMALSEEGHAPHGYVEVRHIATHVLEMLHDALDAFARLDTEKALRVMKEDKVVIQPSVEEAQALVGLAVAGDSELESALEVLANQAKRKSGGKGSASRPRIRSPRSGHAGEALPARGHRHQ